MFAEHHAMLAADLGGIEALVIQRILDEPIDVDAGFVREHAFAHDAFADRYRAPGRAGDEPRQLRKLPCVDAGFDVVQVAQRHHRLFQRRVAGSFSQAVHRRVDVGGAGEHRGEGVGRGQPEIVVRVHLEIDTHGRAQAAYAVRGCRRVQHPKRIGEAEALCTGGLGGFCGPD